MKSLQQPLVGGVSNRIAGWIGPYSKLESNAGRHRREHAEIWRDDSARFDPLRGRSGDAACLPNRLQAQPRGAAARSKIRAEVMKVIANPATGSIDRSVSHAHEGMIAGWPLRPVIRDARPLARDASGGAWAAGAV